MYILARSVKLVVAALMVALFVGCGGSDGGGSKTYEYKTLADLEFTKITGTMHFNVTGSSVEFVMQFSDNYSSNGLLIDDLSILAGITVRVCGMSNVPSYTYMCVERSIDSSFTTGYLMNISSQGSVSAIFASSITGNTNELADNLLSGGDGYIDGTIQHLSRSYDSKSQTYDSYESYYDTLVMDKLNELNKLLKERNGR